MMNELAEIFRDEAGRCTATMIRVLGDIDLAEDAVAEAFAIAAEKWPTQGIPPNPGGWITTTARNCAIDRLRMRPNAVIALNRAVAIGEMRGAAAGIAALDSLDATLLHDYQPYHAARADLLARVGQRDAAIIAYDRAIELTANTTERRFLEQQREAAAHRT